jgi:hypothetical protein
MKHYVLLLPALLSGWPLLLRAQDHLPAASQQPAPTEAPRRLAVAVGFRLGATYSNTNFNQGVPKPVVPVETNWRPGVVAGFLVQLSVSKKLALQQEYLFSQLGGEIAAGGPRYTLRYLSLPLLLKYRVLPHLVLVAGPQADLLIQAKQKLNGLETDITHDTEERSVGATAGLEVPVGRYVSLSARYLQGLNHIGIGQRSAVQEFKFQSVQAAVEVRL